jgi:DNA-directed RNA polymerase omega subunit
MKDDTTLINEVLRQIPNKYMAVMVASKRARAINDETIRPLVRTGAAKPTTMALAEIAAGVVVPGEARPEIEAAEEEGKELLPSPDSPAPEEE